MRLVIISGRSGSGKTSALNILEDVGFTCIDNLPASLLSELVTQLKDEPGEIELMLAVGIDARNLVGDLSKIPSMLHDIEDTGVAVDVVLPDETVIHVLMDVCMNQPSICQLKYWVDF